MMIPDGTTVSPAKLSTSRCWGLPLLARELGTQASQPRLFVLRTTYAVALQVICFLVLQAAAPTLLSNPLAPLGWGASVLSVLSCAQELGLYLLLPILAGGSLTIEKERRTRESPATGDEEPRA